MVPDDSISKDGGKSPASAMNVTPAVPTADAPEPTFVPKVIEDVKLDQAPNLSPFCPLDKHSTSTPELLR